MRERFYERIRGYRDARTKKHIGLNNDVSANLSIKREIDGVRINERHTVFHHLTTRLGLENFLGFRQLLT